MTVRQRISLIASAVGAIVGAGFATGSEINLYFAAKSLLSPEQYAELAEKVRSVREVVGK